MEEPIKQMHIEDLNLQLKLCTWSDKWTHVVHKDNTLDVAKFIKNGAFVGREQIRRVYDNGHIIKKGSAFTIMRDYWHPYQEITDTAPITIEEMKKQVVF